MAKQLNIITWGAKFASLALLCLLLTVGQAWANLITEQSYFEDRTGELTFDQVSEKPFKSYTGILSKGFSPSVFWLKLKVAQPHDKSNDNQPIALRVRPPYLDEIQLYDSKILPVVLTTGDMYSWHDQAFQSVNHGFILEPGAQSRYVWLRIKSSSSMIVGVDAEVLDVMMTIEKKQLYTNSIDVVLMVFLLCWSLLLLIFKIDKISVAFVALQVASLAFSLAYFGFIRIYYSQVISSHAANEIYSYLFILMPAAYLLFYRSLLQEYKPPIWMMRALLILQFYPLLGLILMLAQKQQLALHLNALIALTSFSILSMASICVFKNRREINQNKLIPPLLVAISCWLFTVGSITIILPGLGVVDASDLSLYRFTFQSFFSAFVIGSTVYLRTKKMEQSTNQALARAKEEAYFERKRREEQNVFFAMLTHEIRTPLTAMAYSVQTAMPQHELKKQIERGVTEIDKIIDHCSQAQRIEEGNYVIDRNSIHLSDLIATAIEKCQTNNRIRTDAVPNLVIETDAALTLVVLNNLIENALKYSDPNSVVSITCEVETLNNQTGASILITNQLGHFDLPDPKRLFEKYYRSPTAHAITGSGLGLFLVRSFVKALGGIVTYHPIENKVTFKIWLPL